MKTGWGLIFLFSGSLQATLAIIQDIKTMTQKSAVVVEAEVLRQQVYEDAKGRIITLSTLRIKDALKGSQTGQEVTLYQVGGEYKGRVMRLQGASVYRPGERIVLFAQRYGKHIVSYGLGLGKFNVVRTHHGAEVSEDIQGLEVVTRQQGRFSVKDPKPRRYPSLEAFKTEIRSAL